jgi:hypothetical protein
LVAVAIEDDEAILGNLELLPGFDLVHGEELTIGDAVGDNTDGLIDSSVMKFSSPKLRVYDDFIEVFRVILEATSPAIAVHGSVGNELESAFTMEVFDLIVKLVDDPHVIVDKDQIRLFTITDFTDPLNTKGFSLEAVRRWVEFEIFL